MAKNTFYLGTCDHYNNPMYPMVYTAFVTGGSHGPLFWYLGHFEIDEEVHQFIYSSAKLKREVDSLNAEHASKNMTDVCSTFIGLSHNGSLTFMNSSIFGGKNS